MYYANTQDNLCQVEKTVEETKWRLFGRKVIPHATFLGVQIIRLDLNSKKIFASDIISQENENSEADLINILDAIDEKSYTWNVLMEYDEYSLDNKTGVVIFSNKDSHILATFDLALRILQIFTNFGYMSYEFDEIDPNKIKQKTKPKIIPLKQETNAKSTSIVKKEETQFANDKTEQLINEILKDADSIRIYATMNNKLLQAVLSTIEKHGFSHREANMIARSVVQRAKIMLKSL